MGESLGGGEGLLGVYPSVHCTPSGHCYLDVEEGGKAFKWNIQAYPEPPAGYSEQGTGRVGVRYREGRNVSQRAQHPPAGYCYLDASKDRKASKGRT